MHIARALEISPMSVAGHVERGKLRLETGYLNGAIENSRRGIELDSTRVGPFLSLALLHATTTREELLDPRKAVRLAEHAVQLSEDEKSAACVLGIAPDSVVVRAFLLAASGRLAPRCGS